MAQAGVRSLVQRQPYRDALSDIQTAEKSVPGAIRVPTQLAGGALAAMALPGSAAMQGARYGILSALGSSNPDASLSDRLHGAVKEGVIGGIAGKAGDMLLTGARAAAAPAADEASVAMRNARRATDTQNYGQVGQEQAAASQQLGPSAVTAALGHPGATAVTDLVRQSPKFAQADELSVARKVYQVLGKQERALNAKMNGPDYQPDMELALDKVCLTQRRALLTPSSSRCHPSRMPMRPMPQ